MASNAQVSDDNLSVMGRRQALGAFGALGGVA